MKYKQELRDRALDNLVAAGVELTQPEKEEIDYLVDMALNRAGIAISPTQTKSVPPYVTEDLSEDAKKRLRDWERLICSHPRGKTARRLRK